MALGFNSNLFNTQTQRSGETAGVVASNHETAGSIAAAGSETAGLIASNAQIDSFQSSNPFATEIDYSQFASMPETAGSIACETAGSIAFGDIETAGSIADAGCETAGSVASSDGGSFGSFDSGFVC
ncbi:hypothetical protein IJ843_08820 [bacterium]|nr:hypothetical protein [bacterium]